ncbi:hypothetical protein [Selenomonas ruminantium]|uniref:Uncharacterized protein n=1 Tax=Selenomonas ruminantium TaxID=971 RepID=A0A1H3X6V9_SELRU|nr:hypothetical protein [Selenomonas ruminantium]SDZ94278.1 hypothetical protein SAMN05660648_01289 [Selenomonas ruminantium]
MSWELGKINAKLAEIYSEIKVKMLDKKDVVEYVNNKEKLDNKVDDRERVIRELLEIKGRIEQLILPSGKLVSRRAEWEQKLLEINSMLGTLISIQKLDRNWQTNKDRYN